VKVKSRSPASSRLSATARDLRAFSDWGLLGQAAPY
jgi:hypothetical protein